ncbi:excalibur calcium-binding domain-containing protein [Kocuria sp. U4B]
MSFQPPTAPMPNPHGSSPTKLRRRRNPMRWAIYVLGALFAGFIILTVAVLAFIPDEAYTTTTAATVTVTAEGETKTVTITPEPETTTVTKNVTITPKPKTTTITVRPEPEVRTETKTVTVAPPAADTGGVDVGAGTGGGADMDAPPAVAPYPNCQAVRDAGAAPIRAGEPGWSSSLDADGDGQACGGD